MIHVENCWPLIRVDLIQDGHKPPSDYVELPFDAAGLRNRFADEVLPG
jgi:hypothetical protein